VTVGKVKRPQHILRSVPVVGELVGSLVFQRVLRICNDSRSLSINERYLLGNSTSSTSFTTKKRPKYLKSGSLVSVDGLKKSRCAIKTIGWILTRWNSLKHQRDHVAKIIAKFCSLEKRGSNSNERPLIHQESLVFYTLKYSLVGGPPSGEEKSALGGAFFSPEGRNGARTGIEV